VVRLWLGHTEAPGWEVFAASPESALGLGPALAGGSMAAPVPGRRFGLRGLSRFEPDRRRCRRRSVIVFLSSASASAGCAGYRLRISGLRRGIFCWLKACGPGKRTGGTIGGGCFVRYCSDNFAALWIADADNLAENQTGNSVGSVSEPAHHIIEACR